MKSGAYLRRLNEIDLGDYLRACAELQAGPGVQAAIARLLGLAVEAAPAAPVQLEGQQTETPIAGAGVAPKAQELGGKARIIAPEADPVQAQSDDYTEAIPSKLEPLERVQFGAWSDQLDDIPSDGAVPAPPGIEPLFAPHQTRSLLSRALARLVETGPWDVARVIDRCADGEALEELPRLSQPMLSGGVQLLVDRGDAMMVFAEDQGKLTAAIRVLVGGSKIQVLSYDGFPDRAGAGGRRRWKPYEELLPPPGTVVALLGDLGIGQPVWLPTPAGAGHWRGFADGLRKRGCPVVAFVPYGPARWPGELKRSITMIHWDRPTRTSAIRASVGLGLRVEK
jgi:hypothetical protein